MNDRGSAGLRQEAEREHEADSGGEPGFVEHLLAGRAERAPAPNDPYGGQLTASEILSWAGAEGTLADGRMARVGFSCLVRPVPGDRVLIWPVEDGCCWVLAILERRSASDPAVLAIPGAAALEASRIALSAQAVHIAAGDLVTSVRNRHVVADTSTESSRLRVTQVDTDIRRARHAADTVDGTFLQRMGTWMSTTVREARLTARSFLFN